MIYGSFPKRSRERSAIAKRVEEMLPAPTAFPDKRAKDAFKAKKAKILKHIKDADDIGVDIVLGNAKIGAISQFSLPAGQNFRGATCPGATELCESLCYAKTVFFMMHEWKYYVNWAYVTLFPENFIEIWKQAALTGVVRMHVGGDFFSPDYVKIWSAIIRARPYTRFYAYTRSWQNGRGQIRKEFVEPLRELSELPNMRLVLSCDAETRVPLRSLVPAAIRAWLARDDQDAPPVPVELVFRDHGGMKSVMATMGGTPVCPIERSPKFKKVDGKITCQTCSWCWGAAHQVYGLREDDLNLFNMFAGANIPQRVEGMFRGTTGPSLKGPAQTSEVCVCGADALCVYCGTCALCVCRCS